MIAIFRSRFLPPTKPASGLPSASDAHSSSSRFAATSWSPRPDASALGRACYVAPMTLPSASRGDAREDDSPYHRLERPPAAEQTPVLVEVPHAGLAIPDAVRGEMTVPREGIALHTDWIADFTLPEVALPGTVTMTFTRVGGVADAVNGGAEVVAVAGHDGDGSPCVRVVVDDGEGRAEHVETVGLAVGHGDAAMR